MQFRSFSGLILFSSITSCPIQSGVPLYAHARSLVVEHADAFIANARSSIHIEHVDFDCFLLAIDSQQNAKQQTISSTCEQAANSIVHCDRVPVCS
jgi:hypothetical protein